MNYYINTMIEPQGGMLIHKVGCKNMPVSSNRLYLGNFANGLQAIQGAKNSGYSQVKMCTCCISTYQK
ncbi:TPA: hypothetical protein ACS70L_003659 [Providencia alcalifaciens]|uniref:hypothetical protein n=1 Tax=Providencia TaxID=586 RepID=UPI00104B16B6|nr:MULTISPECIES: hypothetical protein [Providencia]MBC5790237.1 hypothetical protein [Providencia sp. JUb39]